VTRSRRTPRAATSAAIPLTVAAALVLLPGCGTSTDADRTDLLADIRRFAADLPTTSGYTRPSHTERAAISDGVRHALDGRRRDAATALARVGYTVRERVDSATGRAFYDLFDASGRARGWGRVLVDVGRSVHLGIEVPHPRADLGSESLGVELFRRTPGSVLVVAGAHRRAAPGRLADVAHAAESAFQSVHELLVLQRLPVMQLHGFQNDTAPGCDIVMSAGPELRSSYVTEVAERLDSAGLAVCRSWSTECRGLAGTTNVQARWSATHGGEFAHIEVSRDARDAPATRDRVVTALSRQAVTS
jgi:hypothetical protein